MTLKNSSVPVFSSIALYDGQTIRTYIQGRNLEEFIYDIEQYEIIVTYNGKSFDVPVIESCLHTRPPKVHIDLRHILARLGYRGGLKGCEKQLPSMSLPTVFFIPSSMALSITLFSSI